MPRPLHLLLLTLFTLGCSERGPHAAHFTQLKAPEQRERAIDGLLVAVREAPAHRREALRKRVAFALAEAYRVDRHRGAIVSALALLKAKEGDEVFTAALGDFKRGGEYFEAAIRAARLLGELELKARVPELIKTLELCLATPRLDRNTWLERTLIQSLTRLNDGRAVPVLIRVLARAPEVQDYYLNKMAARALGTLGDMAAAPALVKALGVDRHGLLLFEDSRRALCQLGPATAGVLLKAAAGRDRRGLPDPGAARALTVLGDLGLRKEVEPLLSSKQGRATDAYLLALGETALRLQLREGVSLLQAVLDRPGAPLTSRGNAARLLGLYGAAGDLGERLLPTCSDGKGPGAALLCWQLSLAHARLSGREEGDGGTLLDQVAAAKQDKVTHEYLKRYRTRLTVPAKCAGAPKCLEMHLAAPDWRVRERAALDLGRLGEAVPARKLAARYKGEHDQVKQAILIGLERVSLKGTDAGQLLKALPRPSRSMLAKTASAREGETEEPPGLGSRLLCLRARLERAGKKTEKTEPQNKSVAPKMQRRPAGKKTDNAEIK